MTGSINAFISPSGNPTAAGRWEFAEINPVPMIPILNSVIREAFKVIQAYYFRILKIMQS